MKKTDSGEPKATRQCWECLKRRLVCDHTLPGCRKCQKAGKECPGYDEQKPLQWVETGKVTSRRRRRDCPPKVYKVPAPKPSKRLVEVTDLAPVPVDADLTYTEICDPKMTLSFKIWEETDQSLKDYLSDMYSEESVKKYSDLMIAGGEVMDIIFAMGGRDKIEEIVAKQDREAAIRVTKKTTFALERLQRMLDIMDSYDLPTYHYLSNETSEVVQAVNYYNVRIHPFVTEASALAPNPTLVLFPLKALHILPPAIHHAIVCLALNHHIHSLPSGADKSSLMSQRSKVYHHRGEAIRSLSQYVGKDKTRCSDFTISSILTFLATELQNPAMSDWRSHAYGIQRLIDMRGGLKSLTKQAPHLAPTLVVYILIVVMANSCSPSWDQISMSGTPESNLEDIKNMYNLIFPFVLCPPTLFLDIVRVNQLRQRASSSLFVGEVDTAHCLEAHDLLSGIESFVPEDWAQPGPNYEEWLTLGNVYQAAAALYCTMSLQSLTILPNSLEMNSMRAVHGDRLLDGLKQAMKSRRLQQFMMWPLTVAGVEAGYRGAATQYWVAKQFEDQSRTLGTSSPLKAQAVMRRYWQKEEPGWDECFDRAEATFPPFNGC